MATAPAPAAAAAVPELSVEHIARMSRDDLLEAIAQHRIKHSELYKEDNPLCITPKAAAFEKAAGLVLDANKLPDWLNQTLDNDIRFFWACAVAGFLEISAGPHAERPDQQMVFSLMGDLGSFRIAHFFWQLAKVQVDVRRQHFHQQRMAQSKVAEKGLFTIPAETTSTMEETPQAAE